MKTVPIFLWVILSTLLSDLTCAQPTSVAEVTFADGKLYYASELGQSATTLRVQFVHSGAIYEFSNTGAILSSAGSYRVGEKVKCIRRHQRAESLYNQDAISPIYLGKSLGVVFGDGKLYCGNVTAAESGWLNLYFPHSGSDYTMRREGSSWKVQTTNRGAYPAGHTLRDLFALRLQPVFYCP